MTKQLKTIKIIHLAISLGVILAYIILGDKTYFTNFETPKVNSDSFIFMTIPLAVYFIANFLYKSQIKKNEKTLSLDRKFAIYHTATIMRLAVLEGGAFLILILKPELILFGILIILYIIFIRPTEDQFKRDFNIR